ncbi:MAG: twin-arginine translocation signal domain-containing protein [Planctomycetes bacterium]|nr:twin-arginine translocation signal domain-containing protein [Planctomycetota bacterium]
MKRRNFLKTAAFGAASLMVPACAPVIARRPKADAAISNASNARDCFGLSDLAMTIQDRKGRNRRL